MRQDIPTSARIVLTVFFLFVAGLTRSAAQTEIVKDSTFTLTIDSDSTFTLTIDSAAVENVADSLMKVVDKTQRKQKPAKDWATWAPDPKRALWLALVIPGGGQIYNLSLIHI